MWSLGISLLELSTGVFPYPTWVTPFEQLKVVVADPAPRLPSNQFSPEYEDFISRCLQKNVLDRYNYEQLLSHSFCLLHKDKVTDVATFVSEILDLPESQ